MSKITKSWKTLTEAQMLGWDHLAEHTSGQSVFGQAAQISAQGTNAVQIMTKKRRNALKTINLLNIYSGDKMLIFNGFVLCFDGC